MASFPKATSCPGCSPLPISSKKKAEGHRLPAYGPILQAVTLPPVRSLNWHLATPSYNADWQVVSSFWILYALLKTRASITLKGERMDMWGQPMVSVTGAVGGRASHDSHKDRNPRVFTSWTYSHLFCGDWIHHLNELKLINEHKSSEKNERYTIPWIIEILQRFLFIFPTL